jgi:hypothetical protein
MSPRMHSPRALALVALTLAGLALAGCAGDSGTTAEPVTNERPTFEAFYAAQSERFAKLPGVVGTSKAGTADAPVMVVKVRELTPELEAILKPEIEGYAVEVQVVGGSTP